MTRDEFGKSPEDYQDDFIAKALNKQWDEYYVAALEARLETVRLAERRRCAAIVMSAALNTTNQEAVALSAAILESLEEGE